VAEGRAGLRKKIAKAGLLVGIGYSALTLLTLIGFLLTGMGPFDALCHALSAISTGGFSTSDWSLRHWGHAAHWVAIAAMVAGASPLPLALLYRLRFAVHPLWDQQFKVYLLLLMGFTVLQGGWLWNNGFPVDLNLLRLAGFSAVSIATTTGYAITDVSVWGGFAHMGFFLMAFLGGCTGSASGGIKVFRWQVIGANMWALVRRVVYPHRVIPISFNGITVSNDVTESVYAFVAVYFLTFAVFTALMAACGLDLLSALSTSAAALGNVGRAMGDAFGPTGSWDGLSRAAKWLLSFEMIVGRLEIFAVLILFTPAFWKE
jgi:trk system potassium uptake protein TrkH